MREICRRLDGLPLAIELAASRTHMLTPTQLLERLGERLTLLTGGPHDLPARQQTLRDTLDWSAALLSDAERRLLAQLAVFPSDVSLEAAIEVTGGDLDTLAGLVANSMVQRRPGGEGSSFRMLETVREYALELLGNRRGQVADSHAGYYLKLAEAADLRGPEQAVGWTSSTRSRTTSEPRSTTLTPSPMPSWNSSSSSRCGASGGCAATSSKDGLISSALSPGQPR